MDGKNLNNNIGRKRSRGSRRQEICHPRRPSQIPSQPSSTDNDSPPRYLVASNGKRIRDFKINFPGLTPPFDFPDFPPRRRPPETPPEPSSADNDSPPRYLVASNGKRIRDFKINFPGLTPPFDFPDFPPRRRPPETPPEPPSADNGSPPRYLVASNGKRIRDFKINFPGLTPPFDFPDFPPRRRPPETPPEPPSADNDSPPRYLVASNGKRIRDFKINFPGLTPPFDFPVFPPGRRPHQISSDAPRPSASPVPHSSNEHNLSHMRRESEIPVPQPNTPREVEPHLQGPTPELNEAKDESRDQHQGISMNARLEDQTDANIEKK